MEGMINTFEDKLYKISASIEKSVASKMCFSGGFETIDFITEDFVAAPIDTAIMYFFESFNVSFNN